MWSDVYRIVNDFSKSNKQFFEILTLCLWVSRSRLEMVRWWRTQKTSHITACAAAKARVEHMDENSLISQHRKVLIKRITHLWLPLHTQFRNMSLEFWHDFNYAPLSEWKDMFQYLKFSWPHITSITTWKVLLSWEGSVKPCISYHLWKFACLTSIFAPTLIDLRLQHT